MILLNKGLQNRFAAGEVSRFTRLSALGTFAVLMMAFLPASSNGANIKAAGFHISSAYIVEVVELHLKG